MGSSATAEAFDPKPVGRDLPAQPSRHIGQPRIYFSRLENIRARVKAGEGVDEWWLVNEFQSERGADHVIRRIKNGEIEVPKGKWTFEARRLGGVEDGSRLYAMFTVQRRPNQTAAVDNG